MNLFIYVSLILAITITNCKAFFNSNGFSLTWSDLGDSVRFTYKLKALAANNVWAGFGLSKDDQMGLDDIVICKSFGNQKSVQRHFSLGKFRPPLLDLFRPTIGLLNSSVILNGDEMTCSFNRLKSMPKVINYYDLKKKHFFLFAKGTTDRLGLIQPHGRNKIRSSYQTEF
ncbi:unnamed protein product [Brachionus calyciflorus]|uniref:DOMON domain-containing protein n=1 Tax=Brachionus calyciflorus TaxID=104777 RepID=A0A813MY52_9BILA|nr:unnamed protein product [Brachionus calyciflorus]